MTFHVGLVCAAGVSSTFLAHAVRSALAESGLNAVNLEPMAADRAAVADVDLMLIAHHLRGAASERATATSAPLVVLSTDDRAAVITEAVRVIAEHRPTAPSWKDTDHG